MSSEERKTPSDERFLVNGKLVEGRDHIYRARSPKSSSQALQERGWNARWAVPDKGLFSTTKFRVASPPPPWEQIQFSPRQSAAPHSIKPTPPPPPRQVRYDRGPPVDEREQRWNGRFHLGSPKYFGSSTEVRMQSSVSSRSPASGSLRTPRREESPVHERLFQGGCQQRSISATKRLMLRPESRGGASTPGSRRMRSASKGSLGLSPSPSASSDLTKQSPGRAALYGSVRIGASPPGGTQVYPGWRSTPTSAPKLSARSPVATPDRHLNAPLFPESSTAGHAPARNFTPPVRVEASGSASEVPTAEPSSVTFPPDDGLRGSTASQKLGRTDFQSSQQLKESSHQYGDLRAASEDASEFWINTEPASARPSMATVVPADEILQVIENRVPPPRGTLTVEDALQSTPPRDVQAVHDRGDDLLHRASSDAGRSAPAASIKLLELYSGLAVPGVDSEAAGGATNQ